MLTFKQIEALYWVVQLGGFSNAAARLNTTQSAITKRIQELEANFEVQIFDRTGQKAALTRKGEELVELASELLRRRDHMMLKLKGFGTFSGTLRIGITEITSMTWLPNLMQSLRMAFPELAVQPRMGMAWELQQQLLHGHIDMAVIHSELRNPQLESEPLQRLDFAWVGSPDIVSAETTYTPEEIAQMSVIRQDPDSGLNAIYDNWLSPYKSEKNLFTINSLIAMVGLTVAGVGVSCIPVDYFADVIRRKRLVVMRVTKPMPASVYCIMYRRQANSMLHSEIAKIARAVCDFGRPYGGMLSA